MASNIPAFLELPFDWFILEEWREPSQGETRQQRLRQIGIKYAKLGYEGRRPYTLKAAQWGNDETAPGPRDTMELPRDISEVPHDLLSPAERRACHPEWIKKPIWVRTDYGPGTDARFAELFAAMSELVAVFRNEDRIANDSQRYDGLGDDFLPALFAHFPTLIEADGPSYREEPEYCPYDSEEVQSDLYRSPAVSLADEDRRVNGTTTFYVADTQAMRSGYILWVFVDEFGTPVFQERVQPWSLLIINGLLQKRHLYEFRRDIGDYGFIQGSDFVAPWEPPA